MSDLIIINIIKIEVTFFLLEKRIIRCHEEAVHTVAFSPDSSVLLTACTLGNIRIHYNDIDNENFSVITGT